MLLATFEHICQKLGALVVAALTRLPAFSYSDLVNSMHPKSPFTSSGPKTLLMAWMLETVRITKSTGEFTKDGLTVTISFLCILDFQITRVRLPAHSVSMCKDSTQKRREGFTTPWPVYLSVINVVYVPKDTCSSGSGKSPLYHLDTNDVDS